VSLKSVRPEFGSPQTFNQLILRLPTRRDPQYSSDPQVEHVVHFREWLVSMLHQDVITVPITERQAPLSQPDMNLLGQLGVRRGSPVFTANWSCLPPNDDFWQDVFPTGDNDYRWWQVCPIIRQAHSDAKLYSVETNTRFVSVNTSTRFDSDSDFSVGFLFDIELDNLTKLLRRE